VNIIVAGEEFLEELPGGHALVIVEIHAPGCVEETFNIVSGYLESLLQDACEIFPVVGCGKRELRVVKPDPFQLNNHVSNLTGPVFTAGLDHSKGKSVQSNIEDMVFSFEPGGQSTKVIMLLGKQN